MPQRKSPYPCSAFSSFMKYSRPSGTWPVTPRAMLKWCIEHIGLFASFAVPFIFGAKAGERECTPASSKSCTSSPTLELGFHSGAMPQRGDEHYSSVDTLKQMYDDYIHEVIIVNDNSTDRMEEICRELVLHDPRVKVVNRRPPNGVGRALRDGLCCRIRPLVPYNGLRFCSDCARVKRSFRSDCRTMGLLGVVSHTNPCLSI